MPTEVNSMQELQTLFGDNQFVVADFYASWCPPCKAIAPLYEKLAGEHGVTGGLAFAKVNVDDVPEVAREYSVTAMPTFMFFKNGKPVAVDAAVTSSGAQKGPNGIDLIKGADPRALTACIAKLGELAKASGSATAEKKDTAVPAPDLTTVSPRAAPSSYSYSSTTQPRRADWRTSLRL